jgi:hypothetical protein
VRSAVALASLAAVIVAGMLALACGGVQRSGGEGKRNDITALSAQIREWRREAGMPLDPHPQMVAQFVSLSLKQAKAMCPKGQQVTDACSDVCTLAEHICDNAEQICILADELGTADRWAQDKCASAKASCREAKQRCCAKCSVAKASW